jgi:hypothetical protein
MIFSSFAVTAGLSGFGTLDVEADVMQQPVVVKTEQQRAHDLPL